MSWLKIEDTIGSHHKIVKAGPAASWLWICSIAYAQHHLTDGFIDSKVLQHLGVQANVKHLAEVLLQVGLWDRVSGGFRVHDYLKHNASAAHRRRIVRDKIRAGRLGGKTMQARRRKALTESGTDAADDQQNAAAVRKRALHLSPLHSTPLKGNAPKARSPKYDGGTNTVRNDSKQRRRDTPDTAGGRAYVPVVPPLAEGGPQIDEDGGGEAYAQELIADCKRIDAERNKR
jgi:hypothetical protein